MDRRDVILGLAGGLGVVATGSLARIGNRPVSKSSFAEHRQAMIDEFKQDPMLAWSYHCNIAVAIGDEIAGVFRSDDERRVTVARSGSSEAVVRVSLDDESRRLLTIRASNKHAAIVMQRIFEIDMTVDPRYVDLMNAIEKEFL